MSAVNAIWKNGQVILQGPARWPEGSRLVVSEDAAQADSDQQDSAETIARWIAEFDAIEPWEMTAQEEADWQAARRAQREHEKAYADTRAEKVERAVE